MSKTKRTRFTEKQIEELRIHFWNIAVTYPRHILRRRLNLLTETEKRRVKRGLAEITKRYNKATDDFYDAERAFVESVELIIADRAEKVEDPWR